MPDVAATRPSATERGPIDVHAASAAERADRAQAAVRKRSDAYAVPGTEPIEESDEWPDAWIRLGVDVDPDIGPSHEDLLEPGDANATTTEREAAPTVGRERVTSIGRLHLDDAELGDCARAICDPVKTVVMEGDQHAVARDMCIGLQVLVPKRHGDLERRERVLGRLTGPAAVGGRDRP